MHNLAAKPPHGYRPKYIGLGGEMLFSSNRDRWLVTALGLLLAPARTRIVTPGNLVRRAKDIRTHTT